MILLMMVQKSQGQPPGIYPKPNGISTTFPSLKWWFCRISGCHQQIVPMVPYQKIPIFTPPWPWSTTLQEVPSPQLAPHQRRRSAWTSRGLPSSFVEVKNQNSPRWYPAKNTKTLPKRYNDWKTSRNVQSEMGVFWWISLTCVSWL